MITWNETDIVLAIIGSIGLLATFAVYSRASRANDRLEMRLKNSLTNIEQEEIEQPN